MAQSRGIWNLIHHLHVLSADINLKKCPSLPALKVNMMPRSQEAMWYLISYERVRMDRSLRQRILRQCFEQYWRRFCNPNSEEASATLLTRVNTLRPRQIRCHFPDNIFQCIPLNVNDCISIKIPLKFIPECSINNIPSLVQIMDWRRHDIIYNNDGLITTHICFARPQWVNLNANIIK